MFGKPAWARERLERSLDEVRALHLAGSGFFLLLRVLVRDLAVSICILTVILSRPGVLLGFFVIAVVVVVGGLEVMMGCRRVMRRGVVMVLAGGVLLFL